MHVRLQATVFVLDLCSLRLQEAWYRIPREELSAYPHNDSCERLRLIARVLRFRLHTRDYCGSYRKTEPYPAKRLQHFF